MLGGYNVHHIQVNKKKHSNNIQLGPSESITLSTHKDTMAVSASKGGVHKKYFGESVGLVGSFDGILLAKDGAT
eukprot:5085411-Ditylum_brightwellii.AAC.1